MPPPPPRRDADPVYSVRTTRSKSQELSYRHSKRHSSPIARAKATSSSRSDIGERSSHSNPSCSAPPVTYFTSRYKYHGSCLGPRDGGPLLLFSRNQPRNAIDILRAGAGLLQRAIT